MSKRQLIILSGILILIVGFMGMKYLQSLRTPPPRMGINGTYPVVQTLEIKNSNVPYLVYFTGRVSSRNKVELFAEVTGAVLPAAKEFREGVAFSDGEILLRIDSLEYYHNLQSARSAFLNLMLQAVSDIKFDFPDAYDLWNAYTSSINLNSPLPEMPAASPKLRNFLASREIYNRYFAIKSQENRLSKYNLKAPFSGSVMEGYMPAGSMVRQGQKIGTLIKSGEVEIEVAVESAVAATVQTGDSAIMRSTEGNKTYMGRVLRKSQYIDAGTQSHKIFIGASHPDLREGMYLSGNIYSGVIENGALISRSLILPGNFVYTLSDSLLLPVSVEVISTGDNKVVIKGLPENTRILNQNLSTAYKGMKVSPII
jgi:multidrug efflux pump subunit AcrA (membrane-fusion protein)